MRCAGGARDCRQHPHGERRPRPSTACAGPGAADGRRRPRRTWRPLRPSRAANLRPGAAQDAVPAQRSSSAPPRTSPRSSTSTSTSARAPARATGARAIEDKWIVESRPRSGTWITWADGAPQSLHVRRFRLTVVAGPHAGQVHEFERDLVRVGGRGSADLRLADPKVSGLHFELRGDEAGYRLRDLTAHSSSTSASSRPGSSRARSSAPGTPGCVSTRSTRRSRCRWRRASTTAGCSAAARPCAGCSSSCCASPPATRPCSSAATPARARSWWPRRCSPSPRARPGRSRCSTAAPCPRT